MYSSLHWHHLPISCSPSQSLSDPILPYHRPVTPSLCVTLSLLQLPAHITHSPSHLSPYAPIYHFSSLKPPVHITHSSLYHISLCIILSLLRSPAHITQLPSSRYLSALIYLWIIRSLLCFQSLNYHIIVFAYFSYSFSRPSY